MTEQELRVAHAGVSGDVIAVGMPHQGLLGVLISGSWSEAALGRSATQEASRLATTVFTIFGVLLFVSVGAFISVPRRSVVGRVAAGCIVVLVGLCAAFALAVTANL